MNLHAYLLDVNELADLARRPNARPPSAGDGLVICIRVFELAHTPNHAKRHEAHQQRPEVFSDRLYPVDGD